MSGLCDDAMEVLFDHEAGGDKEWSPPTFKDCVAADIHKTFLNTNEFADRRDIRYDGERYKDVAVVEEAVSLRAGQEKDLLQSRKDHSEGLFKRVVTVSLALADLGGKQPEFGALFEMTAPGDDFLQSYRVVESAVDLGMLTLRLGETEE